MARSLLQMLHHPPTTVVKGNGMVGLGKERLGVVTGEEVGELLSYVPGVTTGSLLVQEGFPGEVSAPPSAPETYNPVEAIQPLPAALGLAP